jgi:ATP-binding cassette, subfamily B, bacterial
MHRRANENLTAAFPRQCVFEARETPRTPAAFHASLRLLQPLGRGDVVEDLSSYAHRPLTFMARYVRRRPLEHAVILMAVVAAVGCSIGTQYGVKFLVDTLSQARADHRAAWLAFAFLFSLIAADNLLWRVATFVASGTFVRVTGLLRRDLFRHVTGHSPAYFSRRPAGTLTSRITATSNAMFTVENMLVWNVIPPCVATIGTVFLVATVSVEMAAVLLVVGLLVMVGMYRIARAGRRLHHEFAHKAADVDGEMSDILSNMALVASFDGLRREHRRFDATLGREMMARRRSLYYLERLRLIHALTTVALTFVLLAWAIVLWDQGKATTGDVVLVSTLGLGVLHATRDLAIALVDVIQHIARLSEALTTLLVPHELRDHPHARPLNEARTSVAFSKVHFDYPDGRAVFNDFDLRIQAGERVGLIGGSGSGKSTLIALLQRFYDVQGGRILIDGKDISRVTQHSLRRLIAVVPQDIALFNRTLRENIRYGNPRATDSQVKAAAVAARCDGFIDELPNGWDTVVGDHGVNLSGGQRQRVAIARAFLKNAPVLVMDEATSALDPDSEEAIREAMARLMQGRTVIAAAHRLSTLRNFDRIVVLDQGHIVEDGAPGELIESTGIYRRLVEREITRLALVPSAA